MSKPKILKVVFFTVAGILNVAYLTILGRIAYFRIAPPTPTPSPTSTPSSSTTIGTNTEQCMRDGMGTQDKCPLTTTPGNPEAVKKRMEELSKITDESAGRNQAIQDVRVQDATLSNTAQYIDGSINNAISDAKRIGEEGKQIVFELQKLQKNCNENLASIGKGTERATERFKKYDTSRGQNEEIVELYQRVPKQIAESSERVRQECENRLKKLQKQISAKRNERLAEQEELPPPPTYDEVMRRKRGHKH